MSLYLSKIGYNTPSDYLDYDTCMSIWNQRGWEQKNRRDLTTNPTGRMLYRRVKSDLEIRYDSVRDCFNVCYVSYRTTRVLLVITKTAWQITGIAAESNLWQFQSMLTRLQEILPYKGRIHHKFNLTDGCRHVTLPNRPIIKHDLTNGKAPQQDRYDIKNWAPNNGDDNQILTMTKTSCIQDKVVDLTGHLYLIKRQKNVPMFIEQGTRSARCIDSVYNSRPPFNARKVTRTHRAHIVMSDIAKKYAAHYVYNLLSSPTYMRHVSTYIDTIPRNSLEVSKLQGMGSNPIESGKPHFSSQDSQYAISLTSISDWKYPRQKPGPNKALPSCDCPGISSYMIPHIASGYNGEHHSGRHMGLFSMLHMLRLGIDTPRSSSDAEGKIPLDNINSHLARAIVGQNKINTITAQFLTYHSQYNNSMHHHYQSHEHNVTPVGDAVQGPLNSFFDHMMQVCINKDSSLYDDDYKHLAMPSSLLINAILYKAGSNIEHKDYLLNYYFGEDALSAIRGLTGTFKHKVMEHILDPRDMLDDWIGLVSGKSILHYMDSATTTREEISILGGCGYKAVVNICDYADVIPIIESDTNIPKIDNYGSLYGKKLLRAVMAFTSPVFTSRWSNHLVKFFSTKPHDLTDVLYNYIKGMVDMGCIRRSEHKILTSGVTCVSNDPDVLQGELHDANIVNATIPNQPAFSPAGSEATPTPVNSFSEYNLYDALS